MATAGRVTTAGSDDSRITTTVGHARQNLAATHSKQAAHLGINWPCLPDSC